jgi:hypothetical protein
MTEFEFMSFVYDTLDEVGGQYAAWLKTLDLPAARGSGDGRFGCWKHDRRARNQNS